MQAPFREEAKVNGGKRLGEMEVQHWRWSGNPDFNSQSCMENMRYAIFHEESPGPTLDADDLGVGKESTHTSGFLFSH